MDDDLERRAHEALDGIHRARSARDIAEQRSPLRERLLKSLGSPRLPWPPDLQITKTGQIDREGYRIEKFVFQSLPGVWVPAHLYVSDKKLGPAPAVLIASAHSWVEGKAHPDAQAFAINMARMGFVVLAFDSFEQGERAGPESDHRRPELRLVGLTPQALIQHELRCALEVLRSLQSVDPKRIGMAGADGGGFATWIAASLNDDIRAAVIIDDTTDFHDRIRYFRSLAESELDDHCTLVPGIFRYANNHELLAVVAPRPVLIVQSSVDASYPVTGARRVHEYGKGIYSNLNQSGYLAFIEDGSSGRGFQKVRREAAYGWFLRWLADRGDSEPAAEPETNVEPSDGQELSALPVGVSAPAGPAIATFVSGSARQAAGQNGGFRPDALLDESPPRAAWGIGIQVGRVGRHLGHTQPGILVPWLALRPGPDGTSPENGILVAVDDRGKEDIVSDPIVREAVERRGWVVWAIDPRGVGELKSSNAGWFYQTSLLLGEDPLWRQAFDIRRFLERADNFASHCVGLYARGPGASVAGAHALAMAGVKPEIAVFRDGFLSFLDVSRNQRLAASSSDGGVPPNSSPWEGETPEHWFALSALEAGDVAAFVSAGKSRVFIIDPLDRDSSAASGSLPPAEFISLDEFLSADWK